MAHTLTLDPLTLVGILLIVAGLSHAAGYVLGKHHADEARRARKARRLSPADRRRIREDWRNLHGDAR